MAKPTRKTREARRGAPMSDAALASLKAEQERRYRDWDLARQRIGTTTETRCRWLLEEFVARDPATLSTGELATLRDNLLALIGLGGPMDKDARPPQVAGHVGGDVDFDDPVLVDDAALRALWEAVGRLAQAHRTEAPLPGAEETLARASYGRGYVRLHRRRQLKGLTDFVILEAASLLAACERLRECPECHLLFVARRRQERHPKCARQARDRRRPSRQQPKTTRRGGR
jgi:hypothetical protein